jgi:hypothetical protein
VSRKAFIISTLVSFGGSAVTLTGCNEQSFFVDKNTEAGVNPGGAVGRVCDPSGRTWLPDAMAYTHLFDDNQTIYDTRVAYSDRDGYFQFEDLPGEREYTFWVQYGDDVLEDWPQTTWIGDGETVRFPEPECFDPLTLDVAVVTGDYDDFQLVLNNMGFANYELIDGLDEDDITDFLLDEEAMIEYDIIFFNGGHVEDGVMYVLADEETGELPDTTIPDEVMLNLQNYVTQGGSVYASDWAYDDIERAWPDRLDFVGDDTTPDAAQLGEYDLINAAVSDQAMAEFLHEDYIEVEFDLPVWPPIEAVGDAVSVHLTGSVDYRLGTSSYSLASVPLLVSFTSGEGKVVYSTFRVAKNANTDMVLVLQYMMYSL